MPVFFINVVLLRFLLSASFWALIMHFVTFMMNYIGLSQIYMIECSDPVLQDKLKIRLAVFIIYCFACFLFQRYSTFCCFFASYPSCFSYSWFIKNAVLKWYYSTVAQLQTFLTLPFSMSNVSVILQYYWNVFTFICVIPCWA